jgi:hypothetical protein
MAKLKIAGNPAIDPTLPKIEREFNGKKYYLCFTFGALAIAQKGLREAGSDCNILRSMDLSTPDATVFGPLLYASLVTFQPTITLAEAEVLIDLKNMGYVYESLVKAYVASMSEPEPDEKKSENPDQPE